MKGYATEEKQEDKDAAWMHGDISLLGESLTMGCVELQQLWMRSLSTHLNEDRTINMISSSSSKQVRVLYISTLSRSTFVYIKQFYILCLR